MRRRQTAKTKLETDAKAVSAAAESEAKQIAEAAGKQKIEKGKRMLAFHIDASKLGSEGIPRTLTSQDDLLKKDQGKEAEFLVSFEIPFVLKSADVFRVHADALPSNDKLRNTMTQWLEQFPISTVAKQKSAVFAPLPSTQGSAEAKKTMKDLLPPVVKSALPRFKERTDSCRLYGFTEMYFDTDVAPDFLSYLQWQWQGSTEFYSMPFSDVRKVLGPEKCTLASARDWLSHLSSEKLDTIKEQKLRFVRGGLNAGEALMLPTGWILSQAQNGDKPAGGILLSFVAVCSSKAAQAELGALRDAKVEESWCGSLIDILSLASAQSS